MQLLLKLRNPVLNQFLCWHSAIHSSQGFILNFRNNIINVNQMYPYINAKNMGF